MQPTLSWKGIMHMVATSDACNRPTFSTRQADRLGWALSLLQGRADELHLDHALALHALRRHLTVHIPRCQAADLQADGAWWLQLSGKCDNEQQLPLLTLIPLSLNAPANTHIWSKLGCMT